MQSICVFSSRVLASFSGPAQLSVACSTNSNGKLGMRLAGFSIRSQFKATLLPCGLGIFGRAQDVHLCYMVD